MEARPRSDSRVESKDPAEPPGITYGLWTRLVRMVRI